MFIIVILLKDKIITHVEFLTDKYKFLFKNLLYNKTIIFITSIFLTSLYEKLPYNIKFLPPCLLV
ncbi:hypothetical protein HERIO_2108 [Hepatospora eriocheir]|uniref:Uncharacterized protein n=1 Tax=Hepatospora eriocheir TaxID=1081669 RepID=A0A1X0Q839_9MICR|nr:hypothetical protein HERIO_2108 [Hepatospora eriocheir]